jgi:hypothetical protein
VRVTLLTLLLLLSCVACDCIVALHSHMEFVGLSPYLFAATKEEFMVWNLLTASVVWSFPVRGLEC